MTETCIPFRDFAVAQVQAWETVPTDQEPSYAELMENGWADYLDCLEVGDSDEVIGQLIHAHEDAITQYWLKQMARDGFVQDETYPELWKRSSEGELVMMQVSGVPYSRAFGYSTLRFIRDTEGERVSAEFLYLHDPETEGLLLSSSTVEKGKPGTYLHLSDELQIERHVQPAEEDQDVTNHTFIRHFPASSSVAGLDWVETTGSGEEE